jgi:transitional endoplasmic reticulum ATPase
VDAAAMASALLGETEQRLREVFSAAARRAAQLRAGGGGGDGGGGRAARPVVIFLDELDVLCPARAHASLHESRTVAQLLTLMDGARARGGGGGEGTEQEEGAVIVVAATNRPNAIDPALRRPGRWETGDSPVPSPPYSVPSPLRSVPTLRVISSSFC